MRQQKGSIGYISLMLNFAESFDLVLSHRQADPIPVANQIRLELAVSVSNQINNCETKQLYRLGRSDFPFVFFWRPAHCGATAANQNRDSFGEEFSALSVY